MHQTWHSRNQQTYSSYCAYHSLTSSSNLSSMSSVISRLVADLMMLVKRMRRSYCTLGSCPSITYGAIHVIQNPWFSCKPGGMNVDIWHGLDHRGGGCVDCVGSAYQIVDISRSPGPELHLCTYLFECKWHLYLYSMRSGKIIFLHLAWFGHNIPNCIYSNTNTNTHLFEYSRSSLKVYGWKMKIMKTKHNVRLFLSQISFLLY